MCVCARAFVRCGCQASVAVTHTKPTTSAAAASVADAAAAGHFSREIHSPDNTPFSSSSSDFFASSVAMSPMGRQHYCYVAVHFTGLQFFFRRTIIIRPKSRAIAVRACVRSVIVCVFILFLSLARTQTGCSKFAACTKFFLFLARHDEGPFWPAAAAGSARV